MVSVLYCKSDKLSNAWVIRLIKNDVLLHKPLYHSQAFKPLPLTLKKYFLNIRISRPNIFAILRTLRISGSQNRFILLLVQFVYRMLRRCENIRISDFLIPIKYVCFITGIQKSPFFHSLS